MSEKLRELLQGFDNSSSYIRRPLRSAVEFPTSKKVTWDGFISSGIEEHLANVEAIEMQQVSSDSLDKGCFQWAYSEDEYSHMVKAITFNRRHTGTTTKQNEIFIAKIHKQTNNWQVAEEITIEHKQDYNNQSIYTKAVYDTSGELKKLFFVCTIENNKSGFSSKESYAVVITMNNNDLIINERIKEVKNVSINQTRVGNRIVVMPDFSGTNDNTVPDFVKAETVNSSFPMHIDYKTVSKLLTEGKYVFKTNGLQIDQISGHRYYEEERASED